MMSQPAIALPPQRLHWIHYALLVFVVVLIRLPFLDHPRPVHGDEDEFVAAIGFPTPYPVHHPGYQLWVALATLIHKLGVSPYASYQLLSVLGSGLLSIAMCRLASRFVEPRLAWWAGFALGMNPLTWFLGTTALNYVFASAMIVVILDLALGGAANRPRNLHIASLVLAIAILLRLDIAAWSGPFLILAINRFARPMRVIPFALIVAGLLLQSAIREHVYAGGPESGLSHTLSVIFATSVFKLGLIDGFARSTVKLSAYILWSFGLATPLILALAWRRLPAAARPAKLLLWLWCAPMTAFILFIHASEAGHMLPLVPAIYLLLAIQLGSRFRPRTARVIMFAIALCSMIQFVAYPWSSSSTGWKRTLDAKVGYMSAAGLRHIDERQLIHEPGDFWPTATHHRPSSQSVD